MRLYMACFLVHVCCCCSLDSACPTSVRFVTFWSELIPPLQFHHVCIANFSKWENDTPPYCSPSTAFFCTDSISGENIEIHSAADELSPNMFCLIDFHLAIESILFLFGEASKLHDWPNNWSIYYTVPFYTLAVSMAIGFFHQVWATATRCRLPSSWDFTGLTMRDELSISSDGQKRNVDDTAEKAYNSIKQVIFFMLETAVV